MGRDIKTSKIKITYQCNNNCIMCTTGKDRFSYLNKEPILRLIEGLADKNYEELTLTGGEPTISKDFFEILDFIRLHKFREVRLETNGRFFYYTSFLDRVINKKVIHNYVISLFGSCGPTHDKITGTPSSFFQTIGGIKNLIERNENVTVNLVIMKNNFSEIFSTYNLLKDMHIKDISISFIAPFGRAKDYYKHISLRYYDIIPEIERVIDNSYMDGIKIGLSDFPFCVFKERYIKHIVPHHPEKKVVYSPEGIKDATTIKEEEKIKLEECSNCKYTHVCEGIFREYIRIYGDKEFIRIR